MTLSIVSANETIASNVLAQNLMRLSAYPGAAVAGVSGLEENNGTTCGLIVESDTMFDHIGDWSCRISTDLGVGQAEYFFNPFVHH